MVIYLTSTEQRQTERKGERESMCVYASARAYMCVPTPKYSVVSRLSPDSSLGSGWRTSSASISESIKSSCRDKYNTFVGENSWQTRRAGHHIATNECEQLQMSNVSFWPSGSGLCLDIRNVIRLAATLFPFYRQRDLTHIC